eukprot:2232336-Pyramimonas_sp.AAC.1
MDDGEVVTVEEEYLLKIHNGVDSRNESFVEAQNAVLAHLHSNQLACPRVIPAKNGSKTTWLQLGATLEPSSGVGAKSSLAARVLTYIPGRMMADISSQTPALIESVGLFIGRMDTVLQDFTHKAFERVHMWDLATT